MVAALLSVDFFVFNLCIYVDLGNCQVFSINFEQSVSLDKPWL